MTESRTYGGYEGTFKVSSYAFPNLIPFEFLIDNFVMGNTGCLSFEAGRTPLADIAKTLVR
jgi:hypothetical protein